MDPFTYHLVSLLPTLPAVWRALHITSIYTAIVMISIMVAEWKSRYLHNKYRFAFHCAGFCSPVCDNGNTSPYSIAWIWNNTFYVFHANHRNAPVLYYLKIKWHTLNEHKVCVRKRCAISSLNFQYVCLCLCLCHKHNFSCSHAPDTIGTTRVEVQLWCVRNIPLTNVNNGSPSQDWWPSLITASRSSSDAHLQISYCDLIIWHRTHWIVAVMAMRHCY